MSGILERLIPIDWTEFGVTRGGFFEIEFYGDATWPIEPVYHDPETSWTSAGPMESIVDQAKAWRRRWASWQRWHHVPAMSIADLFPTITATRGGIVFPPAPTDGRGWPDQRGAAPRSCP
jgi:hypothetical protein